VILPVIMGPPWYVIWTVALPVGAVALAGRRPATPFLLWIPEYGVGLTAKLVAAKPRKAAAVAIVLKSILYGGFNEYPAKSITVPFIFEESSL
jgi:hypothetical protein